MEYKCAKCNSFKKDTEFGKSNQTKTGLRRWCKTCTNRYNCEREKDNPRKRQKYYASGKYLVYKKKYYEENKDTIQASNKKYALSLEGKFRIYKRGALSRNIEWNLTLEEFGKLWQKSCTTCGDEIETIGIDRVDNDKPYEVENIRPCCTTCNLMKGTLSMENFLNHITKIYNHDTKIWKSNTGS